MKSKIYIGIEIVVLYITYLCFDMTYSIYWGDYLSGNFGGGLIFAFFGWLPAVFGFILVPVNIALIIGSYLEWKKEKKLYK